MMTGCLLSQQNQLFHICRKHPVNCNTKEEETHRGDAGLKRYNIFIVVLTGCMFLMTGCGGTQVQLEKEKAVVTGAAVTASAIAQEQETGTEIIFNDCATTDLPLKKMNYTVTERSLGVPGYSNYFYVKNNSEIVADDWRSVDMDRPAKSFVLSGDRWKEKKSPFDVARENGEIVSVEDVVQRANGDYVFVSGLNTIVRMTEDGQIKDRISVEQLFSEPRIIEAMSYLGDGRALLQTQDEFFETNVYEWQDESIIHLNLVNIKTGEVEKSYPDGWRLCGSADDDSFFIEKEKKVAKVKTDTGEMVKKYATEAIWSQGWSDQSADEEGIFFHDYGISWCTYEGKLYAKHVGGVFQLDEKNLCWKQLISRKDDFKMGPMYHNIFVVLGKNKLMLMAYRCDNECATDCCRYQWK